MKELEKKIDLKSKEKINIKSLISKLDEDIKNINNIQLNLNKNIIELNNKINDELNNINQIQKDYKESFFSKLIKIISLGYIDNQKIKEIKISLVNKKINEYKINIAIKSKDIDKLKQDYSFKESEKTLNNGLISRIIYEISILEKEFNEKLLKFRDELISLQNELIYFSTKRYINQYDKEKYKLRLNLLLKDREEYFQHIKIKSDLLELIDFRTNSSDWVEKKNIQFIITTKIKDKNFFDTIESKPLTDKQIDAVLVNEINNLILAGAGSGKTSVVVAKVCFLIKEKIVNPKEILILAFNKKAQEELAERFKKKDIEVKVKTFHSYGLGIIGKVTNSKPDICKLSESSNNMNVFIDKTIKELIHKDSNFLVNFLEFNAFFKIPYKDENEFENLGEYYDYQNNYDMKTLKQQLNEKIKKDNKEREELITLSKETVKSYQELIIANYLTLNGINYIYENPYKFNTSSSNYRQYKPDFYLPDYDVYIEHFGIDRNGNTASYIDSVKYNKEREWKIDLHRTNGTNLIETFSYEYNENTLQISLKKKLEFYNVEFKELSREQIIKLLEATIEDKTFTKLFSTFLNHFKSNRHDINKLLTEQKDNKRNKLFLEIFNAIYFKYVEYQKQHNCIDFDDMIIKAIEYVEKNQYQHRFKHIFIDEFQDISTTRCNLIRELLNQNQCSLTVVGDDWQSINRFAGSNISIIQNFGEIFGYSKTVALDYSFRFDDQVSFVASNFVQKNPLQLKKEIKTIKKQLHNKFSICVYWNSSDGTKVENTLNDLNSILSLIVKKEGNISKSVKILDRYNFNLKGLESITYKFSTLKIDFTSVHSSKGLEADYVIVLNLSSGKFGFPSRIEDDPILNIVIPESDDYLDAEERRLFYVALTRTRGTIFLLGDIYHKSPFLEEIYLDNEDKVYFFNDPKIKLVNCPECKIGLLKKRISTNNSKDKHFYGCSNFPRCEYTERVHYCPECNSEMYKDIDKQISKCKNDECDFESELCSDCNDYMIEREGKYGTFLGCLSYPQCTNTKKIKIDSFKINQMDKI